MVEGREVPLFTPEASLFVSRVTNDSGFEVAFDPPYVCLAGNMYTLIDPEGRPKICRVERVDPDTREIVLGEEADRSPGGFQ